MRNRTVLVGAACLLAGWATHAHGQRDLGREILRSDNGWAASGSGVTGGSAAVDSQVYVVTNRAELIAALEQGLDAYGFDAEPTRERLDRYQAVQNTYLATFQTLGGLGLLLGTLGLAAILLRNVLERRGELATMRALGFPRASLARLVLAENTLLLVIGLAIGAGAALLAVGVGTLGRAVARRP